MPRINIKALLTFAYFFLLIAESPSARAGGGDAYERSSGSSNSSSSSSRSSSSSSSSGSGWTGSSGSHSTEYPTPHYPTAAELAEEQKEKARKYEQEEQRLKLSEIQWQIWCDSLSMEFRHASQKYRTKKAKSNFINQLTMAKIRELLDQHSNITITNYTCENRGSKCVLCDKKENEIRRYLAVFKDSNWISVQNVAEIHRVEDSVENVITSRYNVCDSIANATADSTPPPKFYEIIFIEIVMFILSLRYSVNPLFLFVIALFGFYLLKRFIIRKKRKSEIEIKQPSREVHDTVTKLRAQLLPIEREFRGDFIEIFTDVQKAWNSGNMNSAAYGLSAGQYAAFQSGLMILKAKKMRNHVSKIGIKHVECVHAVESEYWMAVNIEIHASALDRYYNLETQIMIRESDSDFKEVWTFIRKKPFKGELLTGQCQKCGHSTDFKMSPRCPACGALRNSGELGWVVSKITQYKEYLFDEQPQSFVQLSEAGIDLIADLIEDRVSAFFWRYAEARLLHPNQNWTEKFQGMLSESFSIGESNFIPMEPEEFAVGMVRFKEITKTADKWVAKFRVKYSYLDTSFLYVEASAILTLDCQYSQSCPHDLASMSCRNCGGARGPNLSCDYCSAPWPTPVGQWLLREIAPVAGSDPNTKTGKLLIDSGC